MKENRNDKKGLLFSKAANKFEVPDLKNQLMCRTRFARNHLQFLFVAVRNSFVFLEMQREKLSKVNPRDNREKDAIKGEIKNLTKAKTWIRIIGYVQIFSLISEFSVFVQSSQIYPTTALRKLDEFLERLATLGKFQISGNLRVQTLKFPEILHQNSCSKYNISRWSVDLVWGGLCWRSWFSLSVNSEDQRWWGAVTGGWW